MRMLIAYHSEHGHTEELAQEIAAGAREVRGADVRLAAIEQVTADDLRSADGLILGSPVYGGTVSHQMKKFMDTTLGEVWMGGGLAGKAGGAFATSGGEHGGVETTLETILRVMLGSSMVVTGPYIPQAEIMETGAAYGATFVANQDHPHLSEADRKIARSLGRRVAEVAGALAQSSAAETREGKMPYAA